jgi:hypothetical protein
VVPHVWKCACRPAHEHDAEIETEVGTEPEIDKHIEEKRETARISKVEI